MVFKEDLDDVEQPGPAIAWGLPLPYTNVAAVEKLLRLYECHSSRSRIPHHQPRAADDRSQHWAPRRPSIRQLGQFMVGAIVLLIVMQAASCGLFFCVQLPARGAYVDLRDLFTEFTLPRGSVSTTDSQDSPRAPKLIPRIIHQTYRSKNVPDTVRPLMQSWRQHNPDAWQVRFYDDAACEEFVSREFPEYFGAYKALPKDVERSDFFRYMVVLRMGGVYADIDVECRQPLDNVLHASDTMVVGWESEVSDDAQAFKRHFVRKRQVLQWFFAAAPGHPVLRAICDHVASNVNTLFSTNSNRDTLDRTGPGAWTDVVLRHAIQHPAAQHDDPWKVRILPRVAFGVHPAGIDGLTADAKDIIVLHHFLGSWKTKGGWRKQRTGMQIARDMLSKLHRSRALPPTEEPIRSSGVSHFPVSMLFEPPFTMLVDLIGHGDRQAGTDISATLSSWGVYQAGLTASRRPSVVEALVGSLGQRAGGNILVDIGAGQGFFSLAAAARGHRVVAFEASLPSLESFRASVDYNGFGALVTLHNTSLGAAAGSLCLARTAAVATDVADVNMRRGYGEAAAHAALSSDCQAFAPRQTLSEMLSSADVGAVGAMRISANGWEGWVIDGAAKFLSQHKPGVILLEYSPALMPHAGDHRSPSAILQQLYELGYVNIAHSGYVCDERWSSINRALGGPSSTPGSTSSQSTWCRLTPEHFHLIGERAHDEVPENIMFIHQSHQAAAGSVEVQPHRANGAAAVAGRTPAATAEAGNEGGLDHDFHAAGSNAPPLPLRGQEQVVQAHAVSEATAASLEHGLRSSVLGTAVGSSLGLAGSPI